MQIAELVKVFENNVWVETDIMGDAHVMIQSTAPESTATCVVVVRHAYPYTDNSMRDQVATRVAEMFGALKPVAFRARELPANALHHGCEPEG